MMKTASAQFSTEPNFELSAFKNTSPYDVDPTTRKLIINEKEAEAVKLIFSMYLEGHGLGRIVRAR